MRTLAIGDIHGCDTALELLLRQVAPVPDERLIFLGDYCGVATTLTFAVCRISAEEAPTWIS